MSDTTTITPEAKAILRDMQGCAMGWEPGTRLLGNSRAGEICTAIDQVLTALEAAEGRAEQAEAENARLRKRLEAALDKIADIQDEWESEGVCHACGICAGIPYEWQPTDDHCCRVMLDLWSNGEPLPWEEAARRAVGEG